MVRKQIKNPSLVGLKADLPNWNNVYATLMINSEYTSRAGTGQTGKFPEGLNNG